jgi:hypothetical protein
MTNDQAPITKQARIGLKKNAQNGASARFEHFDWCREFVWFFLCL